MWTRALLLSQNAFHCAWYKKLSECTQNANWKRKKKGCGCIFQIWKDHRAASKLDCFASKTASSFLHNNNKYFQFLMTATLGRQRKGKKALWSKSIYCRGFKTAAYIINPFFIKYSTKGIMVHSHVRTVSILHYHKALMKPQSSGVEVRRESICNSDNKPPSAHARDRQLCCGNLMRITGFKLVVFSPYSIPLCIGFKNKGHSVGPGPVWLAADR